MGSFLSMGCDSQDLAPKIRQIVSSTVQILLEETDLFSMFLNINIEPFALALLNARGFLGPHSYISQLTRCLSQKDAIITMKPGRKIGSNLSGIPLNTATLYIHQCVGTHRTRYKVDSILPPAVLSGSARLSLFQQILHSPHPILITI